MSVYCEYVCGVYVQVTTTELRLLRGSRLLSREALDMGGGVRSCDITDPYAIILLADGTVGLVEVQENDDSEPTLQLSWPDIPQGSKVTLISAYKDTSGLFVTISHDNNVLPSKQEVTPSKPVRTNLDDEDELLYGDISTLVLGGKKR